MLITARLGARLSWKSGRFCAGIRLHWRMSRHDCGGCMNDEERVRYAFDAAAFAREKLAFDPDPKQAEALGTAKRRVILNCSRQWGKSMVLAARAVHLAALRPDRLVLLVAKTLAQAEETMYKTDRFLERLGMETRGERGKSVSRVIVENGSRIVGVAADEAKVRSYTAHLVMLDEAARVPDAVWHAIEPTLATTNGDLIVASTPEGKRGMFWEVWSQGGEEWLKLKGTVYECPRVSREFIEAQRRLKDPMHFGQEYECEFMDSSRYLISRDAMERLVTSDERAMR